MNAMSGNALSQYRNVGERASVEQASPHRVVQMLMEGALNRIAAGVGYMNRGDVARKGESVGRAISIIEGLRSSLDMEAGGEVAANLDRLYEYMTHRLLEANRDNDPGPLTEVHGLLSEIKQGWDGIPGSLGAAQASAGEPAGSRHVTESV